MTEEKLHRAAEISEKIRKLKKEIDFLNQYQVSWLPTLYFPFVKRRKNYFRFDFRLDISRNTTIGISEALANKLIPIIVAALQKELDELMTYFENL